LKSVAIFDTFLRSVHSAMHTAALGHIRHAASTIAAAATSLSRETSPAHTHKHRAGPMHAFAVHRRPSTCASPDGIDTGTDTTQTGMYTLARDFATWFPARQLCAWRHVSPPQMFCERNPTHVCACTRACAGACCMALLCRVPCQFNRTSTWSVPSRWGLGCCCRYCSRSCRVRPRPRQPQWAPRSAPPPTR